MKKVFMLLAIITIATIQTFAQSKTLNDIRSIRLKNSGEIMDNEEVKGYFIFYEVDKVDRKNRAYKLVILDQNLNEIAKKKIIDSKHLILQTAVYNGANIMLKFYNVKSKEVSFQAFDRNAKISKKYTRELLKGEALTNYYVGGDEGVYNGLAFYAAGKNGFVNYSSVTKGFKGGYIIEFFPSNDSGKKWTFETDIKEKGVKTASFMYADESMILSTLTERSKATSVKGTVVSVEALSTENGQQLWKTAIESPMFEFGILNNYIDPSTGDITLLGTYYNKGDNMMKDKSLGMFSYTLDKNGNKKSDRFLAWVKDVGEFLPIDDKGKIEDVGYVYFHKFIKTEDGKIFGIGEQYKKAINAGAVALNVLAAAAGGQSEVSNSKLVVEDFYIFEFSEDFALKDVKIFEKGKSNIWLPSGFTYMSSAFIANFVKYTGGFDYAFTQQTNDKDVFHIGYSDYDRTQDKDQRAYFGAISYADGEFSTDKLPINNKSSTIRLRKAKTGYVLVSEYFKKEKKLELRLEQINY
jgi:hypothetical protein